MLSEELDRNEFKRTIRRLIRRIPPGPEEFKEFMREVFKEKLYETVSKHGKALKTLVKHVDKETEELINDIFYAGFNAGIEYVITLDMYRTLYMLIRYTGKELGPPKATRYRYLSKMFWLTKIPEDMNVIVPSSEILKAILERK